MLKTLVALALVVTVLIPVTAAFAEGGDDTHTDHPITVSNDVAPAAPAQFGGVVAGPDKILGGPYSDQRLDNREN